MIATVVVVFVLARGRARAITAVVGAILLAGVTIGMLGLGYHYLTDVVGGTFFAVSAVLAARGASRRDLFTKAPQDDVTL
jgi:membrane-associated phospholipid phosphatase